MKKKHIVILILAGLIWFLALVISKMPAALVVGHLSQQFGGFVPSQVTGTIWQGHAALRITSVVPNVKVEKAMWHISPLKLLLGEFDAHVHLKDGFRFVSGDVQFDLLDHDIRLQDVKGRVDARFLQPYLTLPIKVDGTLDIAINRFETVNNEPAVLDGRLLIESLQIDTGQVVPLGTFVAELGMLPDQPIVTVALQDVDAVVALSGDAQLTVAFDYYVNMLIKPKANASPLIASTLDFASYKKNAEGFYKVVIGRPLVQE